MRISTPQLAIGLLFVCVFSLGFALTAQYGFDLRPCNLCLIQRVPFVLCALLAAVVLMGKGKGAAPLLLRGAGLLLLLNGFIAFYHLGVEQHWWASAVCKGGGAGPVSVSDIMAELNRQPEPQCDSPPWSFHGITMAALNIPYSAGLGLVVLWLLTKVRT